ncbi:MAG: type II secretion system protein N [Pseudomonadota bacterium]|jgi:general secretion pathway protein N|nr:MAG: hypothetical protein DIU56_04490 [Pseudomonadota bacterium]
MRRWLRVGAVVAVAFLIVLIVRFPASWAAALLPGSLACHGAAGTVWRGACTSFALNDASRPNPTSLGALSWRLKPLRLFTGTLAAGVTLQPPAGRVSADVEVSAGGSITARNLTASLRLDPQLLPLVPAALQGVVQADLQRLEVDDGAITDVAGRIELRDVQQSGNRLGSYLIVFPEVAAPGDPTGELRDTGGPFAFQGTVKFVREPEPGYVIEGLIAARADAPPELAQRLQFLGTPDAQGRRPFSFSGSF